MENFQVDGIGINAAHYQGVSEDAFIKDMWEGLPGRLGSDANKTAWLKKAYETMQSLYKPTVFKEDAIQTIDTGTDNA